MKILCFFSIGNFSLLNYFYLYGTFWEAVACYKIEDTKTESADWGR